MRWRPFTRNTVVLATAGTAALIGAAAVGGGVLAPPPPAERDTGLTVPVERRTLSETIVTRGVVNYPAVSTILGRADGILTHLSIGAGDTVNSGAELLRIDGRPVVAMTADFPFWRELTLGVPPGDDVRQLEAMLVAAGYDPGTVDTTFTPGTHDALHAWQRAHGITPEDGAFRVADVVVANWPARVGGVRVAVGDSVTPGQELFTVTAPEPVMSVPISPIDRARIEDGAVVRIESSGHTYSGRVASIADVPDIDEAGGETYHAIVELNDPAELTLVEGSFVRAEIVIREARNALAVPLAAVVLDGLGREGVRVGRRDGVEFVPISTGITQGAYVEVTDGLRGTETVLLGDQ